MTTKTREIAFATVTRREGEWVVRVPQDRGQDHKFVGGFTRGREALEWAVEQGYQTTYRGRTYNEGGVGPTEPLPCGPVILGKPFGSCRVELNGKLCSYCKRFVDTYGSQVELVR